MVDNVLRSRRIFSKLSTKMTSKYDGYKTYVQRVLDRCEESEWEKHLSINGVKAERIEAQLNEMIPLPRKFVRIGEDKARRIYIYLTMFEEGKWKFMILHVNEHSDKKNV